MEQQRQKKYKIKESYNLYKYLNIQYTFVWRVCRAFNTV